MHRYYSHESCLILRHVTKHFISQKRSAFFCLVYTEMCFCFDLSLLSLGEKWESSVVISKSNQLTKSFLLFQYIKWNEDLQVFNQFSYPERFILWLYINTLCNQDLFKYLPLTWLVNSADLGAASRICDLKIFNVFKWRITISKGFP